MEQKGTKITTIKLSSSTKERLNKLRIYRRETYEEIISKIIDILNLCKVSPERARAKLLAIDKQIRRTSKDKPMQKKIAN